MPMSLGDFFSQAPHARPVNAKPVKFTAIARGTILPGGTANPHKRPVAATVTAAFVFLGGDGASEARVDARRALRSRFVDPETKMPERTDDDDFDVELTYQVLWRVLHEWDSDARTTGGRLFPSVANVRELLEVREANRVLREYNSYVEVEHPEVLDDETFRDAKGSGPRVAAITSRG